VSGIDKQLILEYRRVYAEVNDKLPPRITYKNGWYRLHFEHAPASSLRRAELEARLNTLYDRQRGDK